MNKNEILTTTLLTGLEAIQKFNKNIKVDKKNASMKDIPNQGYITIDHNGLKLNSIIWDNQQTFIKIPIQNIEEIQTGFIGIDTLIKAIKKFDTFLYIQNEENKIIITDNKKRVELWKVDNQEIKYIDFSQADTNILEGLEIKTAYDKVKKTIATNDNKPILTGIHFNKNYIESLDGYRISQVKINEADFTNFTLKADILDIVLSLSKKNKSKVEIINTKKEYQVATIINDIEIYLRGSLIDGEYMKTESIFTGNYEIDLEFADNKELKNEIEFISDMITGLDDTKRPVMLEMNKEKLSISCTELGNKTSSEIDIKCNYYNRKDNMIIAFNPKFLSTAINNIEGSFNIGFISPLTPLVIYNDNEKYLILPVRIAS